MVIPIHIPEIHTLWMKPCNDYSCYGALEIVGAITITITIQFPYFPENSFPFSPIPISVEACFSSLPFPWESYGNPIPTANPISMDTSSTNISV